MLSERKTFSRPLLSQLLQSLTNSVNGYRFLIDGPGIIDRQYREVNCFSNETTFVDSLSQSDGAPFKIRTPKNNRIVVSSRKHIEELIHGSPKQLSLHAIGKEVGFEHGYISKKFSAEVLDVST